MKDKYFVSICIPSYNRPKEILRALESVKSEKYINEIQIVVCEDCAPKRLEVRKAIEDYRRHSPFNVKYVENEVNYGHGKNWRHCSQEAEGKFLIYLGDDDCFVSENIDAYLEWLKQHQDLGYVLRSYVTHYSNHEEMFRYYSTDRVFEPGIEAYEALFLKSVSMSGYTVRRDCANSYPESSLDATLLYQLYLAAEICLHHKTGYCRIPITQVVADGGSFFGSNGSEKGIYEQGKSVSTNLNFITGFSTIAKFLDNKYQMNTEPSIMLQLSKYSYTPLMIARKFGLKGYNETVKKYRSIGLDKSKYFNLYYFLLLIFGPNFCSWGIRTIKKIYGRRLEL